ncbi:Ppx/GppA phosphatase family protein [Bombilactobacillus thymidiniphilus]|uniref:Ppx/GppA phosphatase N-terminal domain-containing protein n=1 Tax=Bombilactobacillus thymidiniphilus TaxID=2923363 RepID=A0ABY4PE98_9LACO|nr:hypothetical protein [Bombilactobacillus thymidiniphilus]UQS84056.1 hypothetical protein MOO47_02415 [Bombilactobacillus thymidiniphilus]
MTKLALIDIGSNSIRMAIYQIEQQQVKEFQRYREFVQLAKNMTTDGCINADNFQAGIAVLVRFRTIIQQMNVTNLKAIATEAVRQAKNQRDFLVAAQNKAAIKINVLTGQQEAYYDYLAIKKVVSKRDFLFLDTGGGSFELCVVHNRQLKQAGCWPYGAVKLYDKLSQPNCLSRQAKSELTNLLRHCWHEINGSNISDLVVIGGVHRSLFEVMQLPFNTWQESLPILRWIERIQHNNLAANSALSNMEFSRAPFMPVGLMPLKNIIEHFAIQRVLFCPYALRDGVLAEFMHQRNK